MSKCYIYQSIIYSAHPGRVTASWSRSRLHPARPLHGSTETNRTNNHVSTHSHLRVLTERNEPNSLREDAGAEMFLCQHSVKFPLTETIA